MDDRTYGNLRNAMKRTPPDTESAGREKRQKPIAQPFVYPSDLFGEDGAADRVWTCARTRPRWEKRFAAWLEAGRRPFFMPVVPRVTRTYRKRRVTELPLFSGYVFVVGRHHKEAFSRSGCVAYCLHTRSPGEAGRLDAQITGVWQALAFGENPVRVTELRPGQTVEITAGPLMGTVGRFVREGGDGRLVIWVDLLGTGVSIEVSDPYVVRPE
jgi:transcription antitermination factor NusG